MNLATNSTDDPTSMPKKMPMGFQFASFHPWQNCQLLRNCLVRFRILKLPSGKVTYPLKIHGWKIYFLLKSLFGGHVSFQGCYFHPNLQNSPGKESDLSMN